MRFGLKLIESNDQITKEILNALLPDVTKHMNKMIVYIKQNLPDIVSNAITSSPEYESLVGGQLKYELGLVDADSKIEGLLDIWMNNIEYLYEPPSIMGSRIKGSFSANMIKIDFRDVIYTQFAEMQDTIRGYSLPWLQWLLLDGNANIVDNYSVVMGPNRRSRTGNAIMKMGGSWRVPPQFAGTINDNWITRALDSAQGEIQQLLDKAGSL